MGITMTASPSPILDYWHNNWGILGAISHQVTLIDLRGWGETGSAKQSARTEAAWTLRGDSDI